MAGFGLTETRMSSGLKDGTRSDLEPRQGMPSKPSGGGSSGRRAALEDAVVLVEPKIGSEPGLKRVMPSKSPSGVSSGQEGAPEDSSGSTSRVPLRDAVGLGGGGTTELLDDLVVGVELVDPGGRGRVASACCLGGRGTWDLVDPGGYVGWVLRKKDGGEVQKWEEGEATQIEGLNKKKNKPFYPPVVNDKELDELFQSVAVSMVGGSKVRNMREGCSKLGRVGVEFPDPFMG